jgi:hypothetical protein
MNRSLRQISDRRPGLTPPQFSLRTLLVLMTVAGGLLALAERLGPIGVFVCLIAILSVFAHMASTSIGGQLRRNGATAGDPDAAVVLQPTSAQESDFAPATRLSQHVPLNRKPIYFGVLAGALIGATLGGTVLTLVMWHDFSLVNVLFGICCSAFLGSFFGFWISSLFQVARAAWTEAQKDVEVPA